MARAACLAAEIRARPSHSRSAASRIAGGVSRDDVDADEQPLATRLGDQVRAVGRDGFDCEVADLRTKFACAPD